MWLIYTACFVENSECQCSVMLSKCWSPLMSRLKALNRYLMDRSEALYKHSFIHAFMVP